MKRSELTEKICPRCGWGWIPRKKNPVACPACKRYLNPRSSKKIKAKPIT